MRRSLKTRHLSMIALGGSIGTGFLIASGSAIATAGPGGALVVYALMGIMVYFLMTSLGEMATFSPTTGSFVTYSADYVDPAFGFAMGWNYWLNWTITITVDAVSCGVVMNFWFPHLPSWIFSSVVFVLIALINWLSVKSYGETEYWLSFIKVVTIGFFLVAGMSFQGTELVGITAGESADPRHAVPKAIHSTFWRILLFYLLSIFVMACILPYTDKNLLSSSVKDVSMSPLTIVFERAGLAAAASVMNAVIFTALLSAANSGLYASTRMLYTQAKEGFAWKIFGYVNKRGIPIYAMVGTMVISLAVFATQFLGKEAYNYLINASGLSGFIAWLGIAVAHYRFRRAYVKQGRKLSDLKYKAALLPFGPIFAFILCLIAVGGQNLGAFAKLDWENILITYMSVPLFVILYIYYKVKYKTKLIPLTEVDLEAHRD
ncbi:amino acid permease [Levilactobacillus brevis]|uniref:amino acid permease n=1 Tax=Levilactobacillus brevis TaxID=1580 RepID=UPI0022E0973F|nr:amino acid permease [Levilactobacillus brevis]